MHPTAPAARHELHKLTIPVRTHRRSHKSSYSVSQSAAFSNLSGREKHWAWLALTDKSLFRLGPLMSTKGRKDPSELA